MNAIRIALRVLRVDRPTRSSAILTGAGVAVATGLVLLLVSLPFATQARGERAAWQKPAGGAEDGAANANLLVAVTEDYADGQEITRVDVAALGDPSAIALPDGIAQLPGPGEVLLSGDLRELASGLPGSQLAERFPGDVIGQLGPEALAFPDQLVALIGHEPAEMPVTAFPQDGFAEGGAEMDPLLQLLSGVGVVVLLVPSLVLVASAARLTAARRERRLAALRLAGATPRQVAGMVAGETAIAASCGAALGFVASPALHALAAYVPWDGGTWQPGDFQLPVAVTIPIVLVIPVLVLLAAMWGLLRVLRTPLAAANVPEPKQPHWWRLLSLPLSGLFFAYAIQSASAATGPMLVLLGLALVLASASLAGPWLTSALGGLFLRAWRRPSMLLAGRRLRNDPKGAYRASAGIILAVFTGTMALTLLPSFEAMAGAPAEFRSSVLYLTTGADRAEEVVEETNTALARYGQDEQAQAFGEVSLIEKSEPEWGISALVMDCASANRLLRYDMGEACSQAPGIYNPLSADLEVSGVEAQADGPRLPIDDDVPVLGIDVPAEAVTLTAIVDPAVLPAGTVLETATVAVPTTPDNEEVVRTALAGAAHGIQIQSRDDRLTGQRMQLADLQRVTVIGLVAAAVLSGCSAAIATAGSVLDRRRALGALVAAGTPVRMLAQAMRMEAAAPAMVAALMAGGAGVGVAAGFYRLLEENRTIVLTPWILAPVVLGAGAAVLAAAVCRPALNRVRGEPLAEE